MSERSWAGLRAGVTLCQLVLQKGTWGGTGQGRQEEEEHYGGPRDALKPLTNRMRRSCLDRRTEFSCSPSQALNVFSRFATKVFQQ